MSEFALPWDPDCLSCLLLSFRWTKRSVPQWWIRLPGFKSHIPRPEGWPRGSSLAVREAWVCSQESPCSAGQRWAHPSLRCLGIYWSPAVAFWLALLIHSTCFVCWPASVSGCAWDQVRAASPWHVYDPGQMCVQCRAGRHDQLCTSSLHGWCGVRGTARAGGGGAPLAGLSGVDPPVCETGALSATYDGTGSPPCCHCGIVIRPLRCGLTHAAWLTPFTQWAMFSFSFHQWTAAFRAARELA
jgi:hypothetical protein